MHTSFATSDTNRSGRAAIYVRMSTDRQNYSTQHQREHLSKFAADRGLTVVREYGDEGKSGLALRGRPGLRSLLADVQSDTVAFDTILVYDVSRWGRFQDVDESAHYEYICRSAGIEIVYCAEQFENDGSPMAALLKSIKRTMAAEYSRELSAKVFMAQCRFISLGYKQGGSAGYALRRLCIGHEGEVKRVLTYGERKVSLTDRVVFILGPADEIAVLRRVYSMYIDERLGETAIANHLNADSIRSEFGRPWTAWLVHSLLTNEKYLGNIIFNRGSFKLQRKAVHNPSEMWVRCDGAFESPLPEGVFELAKVERLRRNARPDKATLLQLLKDLHLQFGKVTTALLTEQVKSTMPKLLARHFGTITNAYMLAGIPTSSTYTYVETRRYVSLTRQLVIDESVKFCSAAGVLAELGKRGEFHFIIDRRISVRVVVARCRGTKPARARWKVSTASFQHVDFVIAVQLNTCNTSVECYYLLPSGDMDDKDVTLREERPHELAQYRFAMLRSMFGL
jgi:DNA invertase Pin-like site-specific DNA recombinase